MPSLGAEMDAGRLLTWYVQPGQQVRRGDVIAMVETDKADIDVEVFEDGVIEELLVAEGTKVPVGTPLARVGDGTARPTAPEAAEPAVEPAAEAAEEPAAEEAAAATERAPIPVTSVPSEEPRVAAAVAHGPAAPTLNPVLRRLAHELGVDPDEITGTGPGGRITRADVERTPPGPAPVVTPIPGDLPTEPPADGGVRASPYARRLAAERGIDTAPLTGSGPGGAVVARDVPAVEATSVGAPSPSPATTPVPPARAAREADAPSERPASGEDRYAAMRQAIARAMTRANQDIPHYYLGEHVDLEPALTWLEGHNADRPAAQRLLPAVLLVKAVALACRDFPDLNGFWLEDAFRPSDAVHVGVAISLRRGGLLAPAIRDADARTLDELMEALRDLVKRTRSGGLRGSELSDGTITVTNLGDTGVETVYGVIQPPQVALVGAGAVSERPWAQDGMVGARRCLHLTLAADHRASDGHRGALFLAAIAARLREPETL
jgi:pyruvate dehydrogenase E2 component (dihydrolipoamide acetyltransferase)